MGVEKKVIYKDIGGVTYRRNRKARNISIRISAMGEVKVTIPGNCSFHTAERFVIRKNNWIQQKLLQIERKEGEKLVWKAGDVIDLLGNEVKLLSGTGEEPAVKRDNRDYLVYLPGGYDPDNRAHVAQVRKMVMQIGRTEGKERLPVLCASLAHCNGFSYKNVSVRTMKSRWGSCSPENNISLNSALIFLPRNLVDYVILHELVHTLHKNHGPRFWETLEQYVPDAKARRRALRDEGVILHMMEGGL